MLPPGVYIKFDAPARAKLLIVREYLGTVEFCEPRPACHEPVVRVISLSADGELTRKEWRSETGPQLNGWREPEGASLSRLRVTDQQMASLRSLLASPGVVKLDDFLNAGSGAGDFSIEIARGESVHNIKVLGLSPKHYSLVEDPSLLLLICRAKELARVERPEWCKVSKLQ